MEVLALKVAAEVFVAVAMALALAHALEYPGKMQLDRATYTAVQRIYHAPGQASFIELPLVSTP